MSTFFINRPIFAWVIAIIIMLAGGISIFRLPISQYPQIAPPSVSISATYPGASAKTLEESVTQIIEQNMNGLDNLLYMSSQSSSSGQARITLTFETGTDPDIAQVQVQNKLQQASRQIPDAVQNQGIQVSKSNETFLMIVGLISSDGSMDRTDLADFLVSSLQDPISRIQGVGSVRVFGSQYAMRIWLDPNKLISYQMTPAEVQTAIEAQNNQVAVGELGGVPSVAGQQVNVTMMAQTMMNSPEQFANILLRVNENGSQIRLRDVARVEIGSENYTSFNYLGGKPSCGMAIMLATGANALDTAQAVKNKIAELTPSMPADTKVFYPYDTTTFIKVSIEEVSHTLIEAVVLVFLVMLLFLQNFRATLIPTIAVPVVLLGTFGIMAAVGFSINTLTMFGLVLAIGLLVDDAIVVVENVERIMASEGLSAKEATRKSMQQITGALIGIALVLSAVFVPMAFFGGSTGAIYRQFSLTIISAMLLSVVVALVLTPALCATILKNSKHREQLPQKGVSGWFNQMLTTSTERYCNGIGYLLRRTGRFAMIYVLLLLGMVAIFRELPTSFLPNEDQGSFMTMVQLPPGGTLDATQKVLTKVSNYYTTNEKDNIVTSFTIAGFSHAGSGQNMGMVIVNLKNWSDRKQQNQSVDAIIGRATQYFTTIKEAKVFAFNTPPIRELGSSAGFEFNLEDRTGLGHDKLIEARDQLLALAAKDPVLTKVRANGMEDTPQFNVDIDYEKAMALGVSVDDINNTLSIAWGSSYVNDFIHEGRIKKVYLQADSLYRMNPEDINKWYVKNNNGEMVPFSSFASSSWSYGSPRLERFNGHPSITIVGQAAEGRSSGEAMLEIANLVARLPQGIGFEWSGASFQEQQSGSQAPALYAISILVVFLSLAALYESWSVPFSVMLAVPLGVFGALTAAYLRGLENDVYFQVGLLTTIGLSAKNGILIVEFAKSLYDQGMDLFAATIQACRMRLRPILMTSLAFMLGVLPLAVSNGAGANSRHAIGTGVFGGMLSATILAIFFVPLFFVVIIKFLKPDQLLILRNSR